MTRAPTRGDWIRLGALALLWGTAFAFIKIGVRDVSPPALMLVRLWVSAGVLWVWALGRGQPLPRLLPRPDARWGWFAALGLFSAAFPFTAIAIGETRAPSSLAGIMIASVPLMNAGLALVFLPSERLTPRKLAGLLVGFAGVVLLIGPAALGDLGGPGMWAQTLILAAALSYASTAIIAYRTPETPPYAFSAGLILAAAVFATPWGIWDLAHDPSFSLRALGMAVLLGLGSSGAATVLYLQLIRRTGPSFTVLTNYLAPVAAVAAGVALGERLELITLIAFAVIMAGVWLASATGRRPAPAPPPSP